MLLQCFSQELAVDASSDHRCCSLEENKGSGEETGKHTVEISDYHSGECEDDSSGMLRRVV
jgi:hypothetical protein